MILVAIIIPLIPVAQVATAMILPVLLPIPAAALPIRAVEVQRIPVALAAIAILAAVARLPIPAAAAPLIQAVVAFTATALRMSTTHYVKMQVMMNIVPILLITMSLSVNGLDGVLRTPMPPVVPIPSPLRVVAVILLAAVIIRAVAIAVVAVPIALMP
jgi:hypothetical protein